MIKIISYKIYPFDLLVAKDVSYSKLARYLRKYLPGKTHHEIKQFKRDDCDASTMMFSSGQTVIYFKKVDHSIIGHEVFHAVDFLFERLEMPLTPENREAYAYLIGHITKQIYKKFGVSRKSQKE